MDRLSQLQVENPHPLEWSTECFLNRRVPYLLFDIWGLSTIDLFTAQLNNKVEASFSYLPYTLALQGNSLKADWLKGLYCTCISTAPPVPCSSQGDQGRGSSHRDSTVVASKRMVSPVLQLLVELLVLLPEHDGLLLVPDGSRFQSGNSSHFETLMRSLHRRGISREAAATICAAHRLSMRALYHTKCQSFCRWYARREKDPLHPSIRPVLSYMQHL